MNRIVRVLLPIGIGLTGLAGAVLLAVSGSAAETLAPAPAVPTVKVVAVHRGDQVPRLRATGAVAADQQVSLSSEVSGKIVSVSSKLYPGARVQSGEVLARVDPRDYEAALAVEAYNVQQAEVDLRSELARGNIAAKEWALLASDDGDKSLALREPQALAAQRKLESARAAYDRAKHNLERTSLRAPFPAIILSEAVEPGQVVSPTQGLVSLVGSERLRVTVSVPVEDLRLLDVPGVNAEQGSMATITQVLARGEPIVRQGQIQALGGQLDPQTRTAQLIVTMDEPFAVEGLPLLPGAYVDVSLDGHTLPDTSAVPREALSDGDVVWVLDAEDKLHRRELDVIWGDDRAVLVRGGLEDGDRLVVTPLSVPVEGMKVNIAEGGEN